MRRIIFLLLVLVLLAIGFATTAQCNSTTGRNDQTEAPTRVPQGRSQMEKSLSLNKLRPRPI
jgi:hypothetical protein